MLVLAAGDTLAAGASAASQVTCTIFGMELNAGVEVYKVLDQRQLASSPATIYSAPASTEAFIKSIKVVNNDTVVRTFQMFRGGVAAVNAITPVWSLLPGCSAVFQETLGWQFLDKAGNELQALGKVLREEVDPFYGLTGHIAESVPRNICSETNTSQPASGQLLLQPIFLEAGQIVSSVSWHSATTAANTPTHWLFGLYNRALQRLAMSADQTTTAWAAQTLKTLAMAVPYLVPRSDVYYLAFMMVATTVISFKGFTGKVSTTLAARIPALGVNSSLNLVASLPTVAIPGLLVNTVYWCSVS